MGATADLSTIGSISSVKHGFDSVREMKNVALVNVGRLSVLLGAGVNRQQLG